MIDGIQPTFSAIGHKNDICKAQLLADTGFHSKPNIKMLYDEKIDASVADKDFRKRDPMYADVDMYKERHRKEIDRKQGSNTAFST